MVDITQVAEEHAEILQKLAEYDHAPAELRETDDLLKAFEDDLQTRESNLKKLVKKRKSEHKDVEKLQRSSTRRFITRLKEGKDGLDKKLEKEEREYMEAAQEEHNENKTVQELKAAVQTARERKEVLQQQIKERKGMLERMDEIYKSAFDGPSPDFPEEDDAEEELRNAEQRYDELQASVNHEKNVFSMLDRAAFYANEAYSAIQSANRYATYDTFLSNSIWAQMAESDDLLRTQACAAQATQQLKMAQRKQPLVTIVECGQITSPTWVHTVFDNLYTDFMFQKKIEQSVKTIKAFQNGIYQECAMSQNRLRNLERETKDALEFLRSRRRQLAATRREILRRVREDGGIRVFGARDGTGPDLPEYMSQPEEGSRVLARGVSASASSALGGQPPPPEYSEPLAVGTSPPPPGDAEGGGVSFPLPQLTAPSQPSPVIAENVAGPSFVSPPGPPPRHSVKLSDGTGSISPARSSPERTMTNSSSTTPSLTRRPSYDSSDSVPLATLQQRARTIDASDTAQAYLPPPGPPPLPSRSNADPDLVPLASLRTRIMHETDSTPRSNYSPPPMPPPGHFAEHPPELPPRPNGLSPRRAASGRLDTPFSPPSRHGIARSGSRVPQHIRSSSDVQRHDGSDPLRISTHDTPWYAPPAGPPPGHPCSPSTSFPTRHGSALSISQGPPTLRPSSASSFAKHRPSASMSSAPPSNVTTSPSTGTMGLQWEEGNNGHIGASDVSESIRRLSISPTNPRARSASPSYSPTRPRLQTNHQQRPSFASNNPYRLLS